MQREMWDCIPLLDDAIIEAIITAVSRLLEGDFEGAFFCYWVFSDVVLLFRAGNDWLIFNDLQNLMFNY